MKEKTINSVGELHDLAASFTQSHPIFRGVSDESYELLTRFSRSIINNKKLREKASTFSYIVDSAKEKAALSDFRNRSTPYLAFDPVNEWEWLAIAQHHGLPTRMMDWTTNPLVAAYFATTHNPSHSDSAIYVIVEQYKLGRAPLNQSPFDIEAPIVFHPRHTTPRITAQSGLFTVHAELEQPFNCEGLEKWVIKKECRIEIEIMLSLYGIEPASMFPGLDGIAASIVKDFGL
ncbi:MAG: FRG domain-containing protein [Syntrophales bacterium]|jgi:hypothetical protein